MSILSDLKKTVETTKLQPVEIEISKDQLMRIGIAIILIIAVSQSISALIKTLSR